MQLVVLPYLRRERYGPVPSTTDDAGPGSRRRLGVDEVLWIRVSFLPMRFGAAEAVGEIPKAHVNHPRLYAKDRGVPAVHRATIADLGDNLLTHPLLPSVILLQPDPDLGVAKLGQKAPAEGRQGPYPPGP
ncbi:hypothetical protein FMUND_12617 [Fusarium mundagurra]|uniref:Uncharacterized protein n=1 Tax=Fusarium mundagurra TaxID=1567541 RepID=A0A8H6D4P0_9HYPO|nr:hypothetical protein FMUND_12617 [Fusarium mundagurra]